MYKRQRFEWSVIKLIAKAAPLETREAIMWYGTVSYTHLDVYKRQAESLFEMEAGSRVLAVLNLLH